MLIDNKVGQISNDLQNHDQNKTKINAPLG